MFQVGNASTRIALEKDQGNPGRNGFEVVGAEREAEKVKEIWTLLGTAHLPVHESEAAPVEMFQFHPLFRPQVVCRPKTYLFSGKALVQASLLGLLAKIKCSICSYQFDR